jgi:hypothetical protein
VQLPPGNWSLQPVAAEAVVEVTKLSKPSDWVTSGDLLAITRKRRNLDISPTVPEPRD